MTRLLLVALAASTLTMACTAEEGDEAPGGGALSGTWTLPEQAWLPGIGHWTDELSRQETLGSPLCNVGMTGSSGTAACELSLSGVDLHSDGDDTKVALRYTLEATLDISETAMSANGTWTYTLSADRGGDRSVVSCSMTFSGSASRSAGRESTGRFSALAGKWEGTTQTDGRCTRSDDDDTENLDSAWQFDADLFGEQGTVNVHPLGSPYEDTWVYQNSPQGLTIRGFGSDDGVFADEVE